MADVYSSDKKKAGGGTRKGMKMHAASSVGGGNQGAKMGDTPPPKKDVITIPSESGGSTNPKDVSKPHLKATAKDMAPAMSKEVKPDEKVVEFSFSNKKGKKYMNK